MDEQKFHLNSRLEILWVDTVEDPNWLSTQKAGERPKADCKTLGYFLKTDKEFIYISGTVSNGERNVQTIPIGAIKDIKILRR